MYERCGEQYRRRYIEREKSPPALAMIRGRGQSEAQHMDLQTKIDIDELADESDLVDIARDKVHKDAESPDDVDLTPEEKSEGFEVARGKVVDQSIRATRLHHQNVAPSLKPANVEGKLEFTVPMPDESTRDFIGYYDVLETDDVLRDTKTTLKRPAGGIAGQSDQLALYSFALKQTTGVAPPSQSLDYLILSSAQNPTEVPIPKPKKGAAALTAEQVMKAISAKLTHELKEAGDVELLGMIGRDRALRYNTNQTPDDQARVVIRSQEAIAGIEAGFFPPASSGGWWCSPKMCGYWPTCPYVRGGSVITVPGVNDG
jgi:hypothetical protein